MRSSDPAARPRIFSNFLATDFDFGQMRKSVRLGRHVAAQRAHENRGHAFYDSKKYEAVVKDYGTIVRLRPLHATGYNRGLVRSVRKDYGPAIPDFKKVIDLKSRYYEAHNSLALIYVAQKKYDLAIQEFTEAVRATANSWMRSGIAQTHSPRTSNMRRRLPITQARSS